MMSGESYPPQPESVTNWRLGELERGFKDLRGDLKELGGTFGAGMTALQTQLTHYQGTMADKYVTRREFESAKQEAASQRQFWASVVLGIGSLLIAIISYLHPFH